MGAPFLLFQRQQTETLELKAAAQFVRFQNQGVRRDERFRLLGRAGRPNRRHDRWFQFPR
jgi:hypothetical protein